MHTQQQERDHQQCLRIQFGKLYPYWSNNDIKANTTSHMVNHNHYINIIMLRNSLSEDFSSNSRVGQNIKSQYSRIIELATLLKNITDYHQNFETIKSTSTYITSKED